MERECSTCVHFDVCHIMKMQPTMFIDYDAPGGEEWITRFWSIMAERCKLWKDLRKKLSTYLTYTL